AFFPVFFFFQAEDGIRDFHVTGVQTCALPICLLARLAPVRPFPWGAPDQAVAVHGGVLDPDDRGGADRHHRARGDLDALAVGGRSEERRVGKERSARWATEHERKMTERGWTNA